MTTRIFGRGAVLALAISVAAPLFADWESGTTAYRNRDYKAAATAFQNVVATHPDYAGAYYMLGLSQQQLGQASQAVANLRKAVELDAANAQYKLALGQALVQADQFRDAYSTLKAIDAGALDAKTRGVHALLFARAATKTGNAGEAVRVLQGVTPKNSGVQQALGVAYVELGDHPKAFEAFKQAYQADPDSAIGRSAVNAGLRMARTASSDSAKRSAYRNAAAVAEQLAKADGSFEHLLLAGETNLGARDYQDALTWFERAQQKQSQNALVMYYSGQCMTSLDQLDPAVGQLKNALKAGPNQKLRKNIYNQLGFIYAKQKNFDQAIAAYQEAGNTAKVAEVRQAQQAAEHNIKVEQEQQEYEEKMREIEELKRQMEELEGSGGGL